MTTNNELNLFLNNDSEWKKRFDDKQELIFKEIKEIRQDFSKKQIACENRFTKLESNSKLYGSIFGIIGTAFVFGLKWIIAKLGTLS